MFNDIAALGWVILIVAVALGIGAAFLDLIVEAFGGNLIGPKGGTL